MPAPRNIAGLEGMGTKYLPTTKDLRATKRFQQKLHTVSKFIKTPSRPPAAKKQK